MCLLTFSLIFMQYGSRTTVRLKSIVNVVIDRYYYMHILIKILYTDTYPQNNPIK